MRLRSRQWLRGCLSEGRQGQPAQKTRKSRKAPLPGKKPGTYPVASRLGLVADGIGNVMAGHCGVEPVLRKKREESSQWQLKICFGRDVVNSANIGDDLSS